jgi:hypothetical protein
MPETYRTAYLSTELPNNHKSDVKEFINNLIAIAEVTLTASGRDAGCILRNEYTSASKDIAVFLYTL